MGRGVEFLDHGAGRDGAKPALHANPLDQIADEHLEFRTICNDLEGLAASDCPAQSRMLSVLACLCNTLPLHMADEEQDLFPLLRRRAAPGDEIHDTLAQLSAEHDAGDILVARVIAALRRVLSSNTSFAENEAVDAAAFAAHERRHLIVENAIVLPLARGLLTEDDLKTLRLRMVARRNHIPQTEA